MSIVHAMMLIALACCRVATSADTAAVAPALQPNFSSAGVLARLTAQPKFVQQFKQLPNYRATVDLHLMLHDMVGQQAPLRPAPTKVSDAQGVLLLQAAAGELKGWPLMVQVGYRDSKPVSAGCSTSFAFFACACMQGLLACHVHRHHMPMIHQQQQLLCCGVPPASQLWL
jgi:hypothetical protein